MKMSTTFKTQTYGMITKALTQSSAPHPVMPVTLASRMSTICPMTDGYRRQ
jgi:hypothetical protein